MQRGLVVVAWLAAVGLSGPVAGCAGPGQYVWYNQLSPEAIASSNEYVIHTGDTVNIRILGHEDLSTRIKVRADGRVSMPIIGDIVASGRRPSALRSEIEGRLKDFVVMPTVTVNVEDVAPVKILVFGEVGRPGVIPLDPNMSLAEALALSGGLTEYASRDRIFVVRTQPALLRIRFTWEAVTRDDPTRAGTFALHGGDYIVVE
jgi:polysaccharide export outer membrane protein